MLPVYWANDLDVVRTLLYQFRVHQLSGRIPGTQGFCGGSPSLRMFLWERSSRMKRIVCGSCLMPGAQRSSRNTEPGTASWIRATRCWLVVPKPARHSMSTPTTTPGWAAETEGERKRGIYRERKRKSHTHTHALSQTHIDTLTHSHCLTYTHIKTHSLSQTHTKHNNSDTPTYIN